MTQRFSRKVLHNTLLALSHDYSRLNSEYSFLFTANTSYEVGVNCGCTLLQKTHDFALDATLFHLPFANRTHTLEQFKRKGILVIRNPYNAIRSYRNFDYGGMQGMAPESAFEGRGIIITLNYFNELLIIVFKF